jgi:dienelactone hydrolase
MATSARTPAPTASVVVTADLTYSADTLPTPGVLDPGVLDVYAPAKAGPWPVVVMFHGYRASKNNLRSYAVRVADLGFVVFAANWDSSLPKIGGDNQAAFSQAACAVEFARAHAAEYGGDPATMIVFGHSGGAHAAAMVAFTRPEPSAGCVVGATLGAIDALVAWEGNWILSATDAKFMDWDGLLAADPDIMGEVTPLTYLAGNKDLRVVVLVSEHPGAFFERKVGDPWAADSWLAVRDPSGDLRRQLEANGALTDGTFDFVDAQQLLYSILEAQGNPVSLDVMPDSSHDSLSEAGLRVFVAAFPKAAAKD